MKVKVGVGVKVWKRAQVRGSGEGERRVLQQSQVV